VIKRVITRSAALALPWGEAESLILRTARHPGTHRHLC
jgi:hypothetical protein